MRVHAYVYGDTPVRTSEVAPAARLGDVVQVVDVEERVYVVGEEAELDLQVTVGELFGDQPGHVLVHSCRKVVVTVAYSGADAVLKVHPSARLARVRKEAIEHFRIAPADAADLVLRLPGGDQDLDLTAPVGVITPRDTCAVTVDLVHTIRAQG